MRQGSEVRWILLACAVLNCLVILLSVGEYRGMVSDGIYDALISAGSDPNIQLESLRTRRGGLFPRLFVGKPGGDPRALSGVFRPGRAVAQYAPVVSRAGGADLRVVPDCSCISGGRCLSVVEIPQKPAGAVRFPFKDFSIKL